MKILRNVRWATCLAAPFIVAAALVASPEDGLAQEGFVFGADNLGASMDAPGFGAPGKRAESDRPELGSAGLGDYSMFLGRLSLVEPSKDTGGLWTVFRVTRVLCNALYQGKNTLLEVAPKGYAIERSDVHALGFPGKSWNEDRYAISVTGDSEKDAAAGHPAWEVAYDDEGNLISCRVTIGPKPDQAEAASDDDHRTQAIQMLYIGVPQLFSAILTEPRFAGTHPLAPSEVIKMATPCGGDWCPIEIIYDLRPGEWHIISTIRFNLAPKAE
ncbi:hypothetical protein [Roseibium sp. M-1]